MVRFWITGSNPALKRSPTFTVILSAFVIAIAAAASAGTAQASTGSFASCDFKAMPEYTITNIPAFPVTGRVASSNTMVYVNGAEAPVDADGLDFFAVIGLSQGINNISLRLVESNGSETGCSKIIEYDPLHSTGNRELVYANVRYLEMGRDIYRQGVMVIDTGNCFLGVIENHGVVGVTRDGSEMVMYYGKRFSTKTHNYTNRTLPSYENGKLVFSHDGNHVYYGSYKVDLATNSIADTLPATIGSLAAITHDDKTIILPFGYINLSDNSFVSRDFTVSSSVYSGDLAVEPSGKHVLYSSYAYAGGRLNILALENGTVLKSFSYPTAGDFAGNIVFSPGGEKAYAGFYGNTWYGNGGILIIDMATLGLESKLALHGPRSLAVSDDGRVYASAFYTINLGYFKGDPLIRGVAELVATPNQTGLEVGKVNFVSLWSTMNEPYYGRSRIFYKPGVAECYHDSDCGTDGPVGSPYCSPDDVYQNYRNYTCNNPGTPSSYCSHTDTPTLIEECGEDYCDTWGTNYCKDGDVYHSRTCYDLGCSDSACFSNPFTDEQLVESCPNGCSGGACIVKCNNDSECGTDGWLGLDYCDGPQNDDVWDYWREWTCNEPGTPASSCSSQDTPQLKKQCPAGCQGGSCVTGTAVVYVNPTTKNIFSPSYCNLNFSQVTYNFSAGVDINTPEEVYAGELEIHFDPAVLNALDAVEGGFLSQDGAGTFPIANIDNAAGMISFASTRFGVTTGVTGSGSLAGVVFEHVGDGLSPLDLQNVLLADASEPPQAVPALTADGTIDVIVCMGDVTRNGSVNIFDLAAVGISYGCSCGDPCYNPDADLNCDCKIDIFDLATVGLNYGITCPQVECTGSETRPCPNQNGVCQGSFETCSNGKWPGCDYTTIPGYEANDSSCDGLDNDCDGQADEDVSGSEIGFTHVPPYCSFDTLQGKACGIEPSDYMVACYIYVYGWWTKPYWSLPLNSINPDGTWSCCITTGGLDQKATRIKCYLVPLGYDPPLMSGGQTLPSELDDNAVASLEVQREETFKTVNFSGYEWGMKDSCGGFEDPGPSYYSDDPNHVWVDSQGRLHLTIKKIGSSWYATEVFMLDSLGYGEYRFFTSGRLDVFDPNIVVGLFVYDHDPAYSHREIDIEFSRWGNAADDNSQYVIQPWTLAGNRHRFNVSLDDANPDSTHKFEWCPESISFQSIKGLNAFPTLPGDELHSWVYTGSSLPPEGNEKARINMWMYSGQPPSDGKDAELVIDRFEFAPTCG